MKKNDLEASGHHHVDSDVDQGDEDDEHPVKVRKRRQRGPRGRGAVEFTVNLNIYIYTRDNILFNSEGHQHLKDLLHIEDLDEISDLDHPRLKALTKEECADFNRGEFPCTEVKDFRLDFTRPPKKFKFNLAQRKVFVDS